MILQFIALHYQQAKNLWTLCCWVQKIFVGDKNLPVKFKLDTGADVNVLPESVLRKLSGNYSLCKTNIVIEAFGDNLLKPKGIAALKIRCGPSVVNNDLILLLLMVKCHQF